MISGAGQDVTQGKTNFLATAILHNTLLTAEEEKRLRSVAKNAIISAFTLEIQKVFLCFDWLILLCMLLPFK